MASKASKVAARARGPRVVVALDFSSAQAALALARRLDPRRCRVKVGKELFTRAGPAVVERLVGAGFEVFLDLKFHDIPKTVAGACAAAAGLGCWMIDVHASGGRAMLEAAREAVAGGRRPPLLVAVTVLTSLDGAALRETGLAADPAALTERLAALAIDCGLDGLVASPLELRALRARFGEAPCLVSPGVRPPGAPAGDQKRVATPERALADGADFLVVGRPVTAAADPAAALAEIERACERARAD